MAVVAAATVAAGAPARAPRTWDFVRLKVRLMRNGLRGQAWRVVAFIFGVLFGAWLALVGALGLSASGAAPREVGYAIAVLAGAFLVLAWTFVPLLFFGVDETLDPARFALLPLRRGALARGMLAAAFIGIPAAATLFATLGLVVAAAIRDGFPEAVAALVGVLLGLTLGVVGSRALTSAFATLLRSRRVRDLAAVALALVASSIAPLQLLISSRLTTGSLRQAVDVADVVAWTPAGAPYALPFDIAAGAWLNAGIRLAITVASILLLLWWWSVTIESAMLGSTSGGVAKPMKGAGGNPVRTLIPAALRALVRPTPFGAMVARESRFWWRDPRRRAGLVSILMASAVVPIAINFASTAGDAARGGYGFSFAVTMAGAMGGMLLSNQFAYDGSAFAAHLLTRVPGRTELRARATAIGFVAVPVQVAVVIAVAYVSGRESQLLAGIGVLAAAFGAAVGSAAIVSVLAPYPLPDSTNPFAMNSGSAGSKGLLAFVAMLGTFLVTAPLAIAAYLSPRWTGGALVVLVVGVLYGLAFAWAFTSFAGNILDRRGPEILIAVTPRR